MSRMNNFYSFIILSISVLYLGCSSDSVLNNRASREALFFTTVKAGMSQDDFDSAMNLFCSQDRKSLELFQKTFSYRDSFNNNKLVYLRLKHNYEFKYFLQSPPMVINDTTFLCMLDSLEYILGKASRYENYLFRPCPDKSMASGAYWFSDSISTHQYLSDCPTIDENGAHVLQNSLVIWISDKSW